MRDDSRIIAVDGQKFIPSTRSTPRTPNLNVAYGVGGKRVKVRNNSNPKPKNAKVQNIEIQGAVESNFCSEGRRFDFLSIYCLITHVPLLLTHSTTSNKMVRVARGSPTMSSITSVFMQNMSTY